MGKKATVNGFTGGLSLDLNPLTNTKEVLSDAINASLITGNGDEMILQNDMGNIKVPNAVLPEGYIPVGVKEFGGIAYMALFNPKTGKGQLGTFPSPHSYMITIDFNKNFGYTSDGTNIPENLNDMGLQVTQGESVEDGTYQVQLRTGDDLDITISPDNGQPLYYAANIENIYNKNKMWNLSWQVYTNTGRVEDLPIKPTKNDTDVKYVTSYTGPAGNLVLKVARNKVNKFTSSCSYISSANRNRVLSYLPTSDIAYNDIKNTTGDILVFISEYIYNCPDGQYNDTKIQGKESEYIPANVINGIEYTIGTKKYYFKHSVGTVVNTYDSVNNQFKIQVVNIINVATTDIINNIISYSSAPVTYNNPQEELRISGEIDVTKIGTNKLFLNTWNYYFDGSNNILRWGFEDYLLYGQDIRNLKFTFIDITDKYKSITITPEERKTYNGVFVQENLYENQIVMNQIYLCDISFQLQSEGAVYHEYRWLNTSGMYNDAYNDGVQDFGSNEIFNYNNIVLDVNIYDSEHIYGTKSTDIKNEEGQGLIKIKDNDIALKQLYTNTINIDVSTKGIFELQNDMFVLDNITNVNYITQKYTGIDASPNKENIPIEYVGNQTTSDFVVNNSTAYVNNSDRTSASKLYADYDDDSIFLRFSFQNKTAIESKYTTPSNDITFTSFFRPFVIDPYKVKKDLCESLMSNYLAFGYELNSDLLPQYYYMDESILNAGKWAVYNRFIMDRRTVVNNSMGSNGDDNTDDPIIILDDSPATTTDLGASYTQITDEVANRAMKEISNNAILNKYISGLADSTTVAKLQDVETISIGGAGGRAFNTIASIATGGLGFIFNAFGFGGKKVSFDIDVTSPRSSTNNIIKGTDFDLFSIYSLTYGNSEILPSFFFWGSYNLIDGATDIGEDTDTENIEYRTGVRIDADGNDPGGGKYIRMSSSTDFRSTDNYYGKFLAPFWLNNDLTYTSTNLIYLTPWDNNNDSTTHTNTVKDIVQAIINTYKDYYLYTEQDITVPGDNIMFIDVNNAAYTKEFSNRITFKNYTIELNSDLLLLNGLNYNTQYLQFLNNYSFGDVYSTDSIYSNRIQLIDIGKFTIKSRNNDILWTYNQPSMGIEIDKFNSPDSIDYSVLVSPKNDPSTDTDYDGNTAANATGSGHIFKTSLLDTYFTCNNKPFNKYMCYTKSGSGNSATISQYNSNTGYMQPVLVKLSNLTYSTLLLKTKNNNSTKSVWTTQGGNLVPNYKNATRNYVSDTDVGKYMRRKRGWHISRAQIHYKYLPINIAAEQDIYSHGTFNNKDNGTYLEISKKLNI